MLIEENKKIKKKKQFTAILPQVIEISYNTSYFFGKEEN